ncbi:MAG: hypothetical protein HYY16_04235 [Planctomycetes bacterium]|nr:hypothetical protein [Planctomycetota bacterium]
MVAARSHGEIDRAVLLLWAAVALAGCARSPLPQDKPPAAPPPGAVRTQSESTGTETYPAQVPLRVEAVGLSGDALSLTLATDLEGVDSVGVHGIERWLGHPRRVRRQLLGQGRYQFEFGPVRGLRSGAVLSFCVELMFAKPLLMCRWDVSRLKLPQEVVTRGGQQWRLLEVVPTSRKVGVRMEATGDSTAAAEYAELCWGQSTRVRSSVYEASLEGERTLVRMEFPADPNDLQTRTVALELFRAAQCVEVRNVRLP